MYLVFKHWRDAHRFAGRLAIGGMDITKGSSTNTRIIGVYIPTARYTSTTPKMTVRLNVRRDYTDREFSLPRDIQSAYEYISNCLASQMTRR